MNVRNQFILGLLLKITLVIDKSYDYFSQFLQNVNKSQKLPITSHQSPC